MAAIRSPRSGDAKDRDLEADRVVAKHQALQFVLVFGLCILAYVAITLIPGYREYLFVPYLEATARVCGEVLQLLGEEVSVNGSVVSTAEYQLQIRRGCDAIEPCALFASATIAFPGTWRHRLAGIVAGTGLLLGLNGIRIVSLYFVGTTHPDSFEFLHVQVWQPLFVIAAAVLWFLWARWSIGRRRAQAKNC